MQTLREITPRTAAEAYAALFQVPWSNVPFTSVILLRHVLFHTTQSIIHVRIFLFGPVLCEASKYTLHIDDLICLCRALVPRYTMAAGLIEPRRPGNSNCMVLVIE